MIVHDCSPNADGTIARGIYPFGSVEPEIVKPDAYIEKACTAEEDWGRKGLPVSFPGGVYNTSGFVQVTALVCSYEKVF